MTTQAWNRRNLKGFTIPLGFCTMKHGFAHWKLVRKLCAKTTCEEETPHSFPTVTYLPIVQVTHWEASSTPCPHVFIKDPLPRGCRVLLQSFANADDLSCSWFFSGRTRTKSCPSIPNSINILCTSVCITVWYSLYTQAKCMPHLKTSFKVHCSKQSLDALPVLLFCSFSVFPALTPSAASLTSTTFSTLAFRPSGQLIVDRKLRIQSTTKGWYCWNNDNSYMSNSWKKSVWAKGTWWIP